MALNNLFKRRKKKLYFALVVADRPTEGFTFQADADCTMFMISGETVPQNVIPRSVLREVVDRFMRPTPLDGKVTVTETTKS